MKPIIAPLLILAALAAANAPRPAGDPGPVVGRYQIYSGTSLAYGDGLPTDAALILRLDTATGRTDLLSINHGTNRPGIRWLPIPDK